MKKQIISFKDLSVKTKDKFLFQKVYEMNIFELSLFLKSQIVKNPLLDLLEIKNYDYSFFQADLILKNKLVLANKSILPNLKIKKNYLSKDRFFFLQVKKAENLIKIVSSRERLLKKIGQFLCDYQEKTLIGTKKYFIPISVNQIALKLKISPSSVYRIIKSKYIKTDKNIIEITKLLPQSLGKISVGEIKKKIAIILKKGKITDQKLSQKLQEIYKINISRRTVCKYRNQN